MVGNCVFCGAPVSVPVVFAFLACFASEVSKIERYFSAFQD